MPTITVLDALNNPQAIEVPNSNGRRLAASSRPVVLSSEDLAAINLLANAANQAVANGTLSDILARLNDPLGVTQDGAFDVNITNEEVVTTFDPLTYPGVKPGDGVTVTDGSARIVRVPRHVTSTGSAQTAAAANPNRVYLDLFNSSDTDQWYRFDGTAAVGGAGSIQLRPGDRDIYDGARVTPTGAISVICGSAGKVLSVWEA